MRLNTSTEEDVSQAGTRPTAVAYRAFVPLDALDALARANHHGFPSVACALRAKRDEKRRECDGAYPYLESSDHFNAWERLLEVRKG